jgi:hypothetical protein
MLPAPLFYVYLGWVGRDSLEAATDGAGHTRSPAEWALTIIGLLATLVVTVYVTRLARRAVKQHADVARMGKPKRPRPGALAKPRGWPWGATAAGLLALGFLGLAVATQWQPDLVPRWLGFDPVPPPDPEITP